MKTNKNSKLKGSVLFTVVSVMSLLIIFLTGTLVLAASANKRAHRTYCTSQAEYTARAAIESFTEAMTHNPDVSGAVINLTGTIYPYVEMDSSGMGKLVCDVKYADGSVVNEDNRIKVEKLGDTKYYYTSNGWEALQTVKVTATAKVGKEEKSVSVYIRKKAPNEIKPSPLKGLQTAGGNTVDSTSGTYTGALVLGALNPADDFSLNADVETRSDLNFINGNFHSGDNGSKIYIDSNVYTDDATGAKNTCGTVVMGSLELDHGSQLCRINYEMKAPYTPQEIPYLFVNEHLTTTPTVAIAVRTDKYKDTATEKHECPFNVFAGWCDLNQSNTIEGDLYLMDSDKTSSLTNQGKLIRWISDTLSSQSGNNGGSVYSMGSLKVENTKIAGDLRVVGDLELGNEVIVNGNIVVGGGIYLNEKALADGIPKSTSLTGATAIYCDHIYAGNAIKSGYTEELVTIMPTPRAEVINTLGDAEWKAAGGQDWTWGACIDDNKIVKLATYDADTYTHTIYKAPDGTIVPEDVAVDKIEITDTIFSSGTLNGIPVKHLSTRPSSYSEIYPTPMTREALLGEPGYEQYKVIKTLKEIRDSLNITLDETTGDPKGFDTDVYPQKPAQMEAKIGISFDDLRNNYGYNGSGLITGTTYFGASTDYKNIKTIKVEPASDDVWLVFEDASLPIDTVIAINEQDHPVKIALIGDLDIEKGAILTKSVYDEVVNNNVPTISDSDKIKITWYGIEETAISCKLNTTISGTAKLPYTSLEMLVEGYVDVKYSGTYKTDSETFKAAWIGGALLKEAKTNNNFRMAYCQEGGGGSSSDEIVTAGGTYIISHYDQY